MTSKTEAIPGNMRALIVVNDGYNPLPLPDIEIDIDSNIAEQEIPTPRPARGQVLIRVIMASVNPSDVMFINGVYGQPRVAGKPAGFEAVGEVVASGGGFMANRLIGKRVSFFAGISGAWAQYAVSEAQTCIPVRQEVSDENAAALLVNPLSAWAMQDIARRSGAKSYILTAGGSQLCKLLVGLAKDQGFRAICLVRRDDQTDQLKQLGAAHVLNSEAADFAARLETVVKQEKPRILFDALSGPFSHAVFKAMGNKSRWIVYGALDPEPAPLPDPSQLIFRSKKVEGFWLTSWLRQQSLIGTLMASRGVQARFASGDWNTPVVAHIPISETRERLPDILAGPNQGKVMLVP